MDIWNTSNNKKHVETFFRGHFFFILCLSWWCLLVLQGNSYLFIRNSTKLLHLLVVEFLGVFFVSTKWDNRFIYYRTLRLRYVEVAGKFIQFSGSKMTRPRSARFETDNATIDISIRAERSPGVKLLTGLACCTVAFLLNNSGECMQDYR